MSHGIKTIFLIGQKQKGGELLTDLIKITALCQEYLSFLLFPD